MKLNLESICKGMDGAKVAPSFIGRELLNPITAGLAIDKAVAAAIYNKESIDDICTDLSYIMQELGIALKNLKEMDRASQITS